ncbi:hypothetical protein [Mesobacillus zeae]|uniref:Uncharacterized protein n=1 Tax=Mesobacillus zeae TaxID=1917180 RepID=A0A398B9I2_9BACI|nr:hypothetical protein [Mesobacillus zeae]RID86645.1 hypothetical protein D1970_06870 [Mesobacillus zeae]
MKKLKYWGAAAVIGLLIGVVSRWATTEMKDRKDSLNKPDAFMYKDNGILYWFELTSRRGKVEGQLHQQKIIEEIGEVPFIKEKKYPLNGDTTEKGYEFKVNSGGKMMTFDAWFSGGNLLVQEQGKKDNKLFRAVDQEELDQYVKAIQQELESAIYHSEEKEKSRIRKFFSELDSVYGYLYFEENEPFQLFLTVDESTLEGDVSGSLLMMTDTGDKNKPYEETKYEVVGITDGLMLELFTTVDGRKTKVKGNFHGDATEFDLSFWTTDQKLPFHAVTEEEFKQSYEEFKTKAQK